MDFTYYFRTFAMGGLAEGAAALAPTAGEVAGTLAGAAGVGAAATAGLAVGIAGGAAYGLARGTGCVLENTRGRGRAGRPARQRHERRHSAPALHAALRQQHFRQPASSRASSQSGFQLQAQAWGLNPVPQLPCKLPQLRTVPPEPPASAELQPAGPRHRGGRTSACKEAWR